MPTPAASRIVDCFNAVTLYQNHDSSTLMAPVILKEEPNCTCVDKVRDLRNTKKTAAAVRGED